MRSVRDAGHLLMIGMVLCCTAAWGDDALKRRVEAEYPPALARLEARYGSMHGRARRGYFEAFPGRPPVNETRRLDFAFAPGSGRMDVTLTGPDEPEKLDAKTAIRSVYGANAQYGFELVQRRADNGLTLQTVLDDPKRRRILVGSRYGYEVQCAHYFGKVPFSTYFNSKTLRIDSVVELDAPQGSKPLLIRPTVVPPANWVRPPNSLDVDGWLVVSPNEGWITREYGQTFGRAKFSTNIGKIEYGRSPDGHLDPIKHVQRGYMGRVTRDDPGVAVLGFDLDFESVTYEALPESEFRLPAFGLPDIDPGDKKGASTGRPRGLFALAAVGYGPAGGAGGTRGGLDAQLGDGSVRFVRNMIRTWPLSPITGDPAAFRQALATRAGGEGPPDADP